MTDLSSLPELLDRVSVAKGPDREIDCWLGWIADLADSDDDPVALSWREKINRSGFQGAVAASNSLASIWSRIIPRYTDSVDACIALAERVLPGRSGHVNFGRSPTQAGLFDMASDRWDFGIAASPALALLAAILAALIANKKETT